MSGGRGGPALQRIRARWVGHPGTDWAIASLLTSLHFLAVRLSGAGDVLGWPGNGQRLGIYTTTATVVAITGSFVTAAVAQYASGSGRRMRILRTSEALGSQFRRNWVSILSATLAISGICLLASILDTTGRDHGGVHWAVELALLLGIARSYRVLYLFRAVITAGDADLGEMP
ncbi:hypothetical protein [Kitasatospora sp. NPDC088346]|uniref:hypothetical protein n=1 Tax=Kitasatospora sp. NPDC088346 TaxID=3364073 RepID=UPI0038145055